MRLDKHREWKNKTTTIVTTKCNHVWGTMLPGVPIYLGSTRDADPYTSSVDVDISHLDYLVGLGETLSSKFGIQIYIPWDNGSGITASAAYTLAGLLDELIRTNRTAGIFCMGGHGRTGTAAAYLMGIAAQLKGVPYVSVKELLDELRLFHCSHAVETTAQITSLVSYLDIPDGGAIPSYSYHASTTPTTKYTYDDSMYGYGAY